MIQTARRIQHVEEYYFSKKLAEVRSLDSKDFPVINLGIGSPDMAPANDVIEALKASAENPANHGYQNYKGIPAFRKAIADFYNRIYHVTLNADSMILPLMGSKEGIMHVSMAFVNEGDEVLIPDPGYPTYASVSNLVGATTRTYNLLEENDWSIDIDALRKSDLSRVKIMWINTPHMPTGKVASQEELKALVDLARENNFLLVNDNPYSLILNDSPVSILSIEGANEVALELNSLSKSHNMAGWRLGWVTGNVSFIDAVLRVKSNMDSGMFLGLQHAATKALANDDTWFVDLNKIYKERKLAAQNLLRLLNCRFNEKQVGLFVWARVPDEIKNVEGWIDEILYETKVFITPGFIFGKNGDRFIRISLCATSEVMNRAFERIQQFVEKKSKQAILK
jgi:LL-diaminopimelate aminotransferase